MMIKEVRLFSAARTMVLLSCISVLCLASLVRGVDVHPFGPASNDSFIREFKRGVKLETDPEVLAQCGRKVTLTCGATAVNDEFTSVKLFWVEKRTERELCRLERGVVREDGAPCTAGSSGHQLVLTLTDMKPVNQGEYICKLHSNLAIDRSSTQVKLQECTGKSASHYSKDPSQMECSFQGVYPLGTIHWFKGDINVTDSSTPETRVDQEGLFHVRSTLPVQPEDVSQSYNCSLWRPDAHTYQTMSLPGRGELESSGNAVTPQWVLVGLLVVRFMI